MINRRKFLLASGAAGGAAAAGLTAAAAGTTSGTSQAARGRKLSFTATASVPPPPLKGHLVHQLAGQVDLQTGTGEVTARVMAAPSTALPGLTRTIKVTSVSEPGGGRYVLGGRIEEPASLPVRERRDVLLTVDRGSQVVLAPAMGIQVQHAITSLGS